MRLLCPNCDAQYEVDDSVIPKDGRDVQCSSCGQTWFQKSASQLGDTDQPSADQANEQDVVTDQPDPKPEVEPEVEQVAEAEAEAEIEIEPDNEPEPEPELETEHEPLKADEAVLDVLRQEAALETEARHEEAQGGLETQPDLGLDDKTDNSEASLGAEISQRTAHLRGIEPEIETNASRSDLLPDIEEINSSLQNESAAETEEAIAEIKRGRSGFRLGFGLIIILATLLFLAYVYAPQIVESAPSAEAFMVNYVETVDGLRLWLDQLMKSATEKMSSGTAES